MKNRFFFIIISIVLLFSSCERTPLLPPNFFYFQVKNNDVPVPDSMLSKTILYYYDNGRYVANPSDINTAPHSPIYDDTTLLCSPGSLTSGLDSAGVLASIYIVEIAARGFNTMYLKFPDGNVDTLFVTVDSLSRKDGAKNKCYCIRPFKIVRFNGKDAPESAELHSRDGGPVFVFEK